VHFVATPNTAVIFIGLDPPGEREQLGLHARTVAETDGDGPERTPPHRGTRGPAPRPVAVRWQRLADRPARDPAR